MPGTNQLTQLAAARASPQRLSICGRMRRRKVPSGSGRSRDPGGRTLEVTIR
jgi:hypothetical protein